MIIYQLAARGPHEHNPDAAAAKRQEAIVLRAGITAPFDTGAWRWPT